MQMLSNDEIKKADLPGKEDTKKPNHQAEDDPKKEFIPEAMAKS